jgi:hypothetical protein
VTSVKPATQDVMLPAIRVLDVMGHVTGSATLVICASHVIRASAVFNVWLV